MACTTVECLPPITGRENIPLGNTFGFRQLREQRLEKCGLCPITLHFSRPLIGGRQATVVQMYRSYNDSFVPTQSDFILLCRSFFLTLLLKTQIPPTVCGVG